MSYNQTLHQALLSHKGFAAIVRFSFLLVCFIFEHTSQAQFFGRWQERELDSSRKVSRIHDEIPDGLAELRVIERKIPRLSSREQELVLSLEIRYEFSQVTQDVLKCKTLTLIPVQSENNELNLMKGTCNNYPLEITYRNKGLWNWGKNAIYVTFRGATMTRIDIPRHVKKIHLK